MNNMIENIGLTARDINTLMNILHKHSSVKEVVVFGSRAKGTYKPNSDIDLAIMNTGVNSQDILAIKSEIEESSLPYFVDILNYPTIKTTELVSHINRVGVMFYKN